MVGLVSKAEPETSEKEKGRTRRWGGYVCPACRVVFRMPRDHDGKGVVCPSCRRLLRLPRGEDEVAPLVLPARPGSGMPETGGRDGERRRHRRHEEKPDWENEDGAARATGSGFRGMWLWVGFGGLTLLLVFGGLLRFLSGGGGESGALPGWEGLVPLGVEEIGADSAEGAPVDDETAREAAGDPGEVLVEAESVVRRFLAARSVEDLLPLVRHPGVVGPKIRQWAGEHGFGGPELKEFGVNRMVVFRNGLASVTVKTSDFRIRQIVVEKDDEGFKVDWESWVGWSEVPWKKLRETRPTEPRLFRVTVQLGKYYNFGFSDDEEWRCYQLSKPDGTDFIFGYVKRGSELDMKMAGVGEKPVAMTLMIRFPEEAPADNQVIIDSVVASGWVTDAN